MNVDALNGEVTALGNILRARNERMVTAESCTGGLIAAACTAVAGSSDWFERGFVTYSNDAKSESIGVPTTLIAQHGAVSEELALAMAAGAAAACHGRATWAVAVTGIAGPGGATPGKPVGTVWIAWGQHGLLRSERLQLAGDRSAVRRQTVEIALRRLTETVGAALLSP